MIPPSAALTDWPTQSTAEKKKRRTPTALSPRQPPHLSRRSRGRPPNRDVSQTAESSRRVPRERTRRRLSSSSSSQPAAADDSSLPQLQLQKSESTASSQLTEDGEKEPSQTAIRQKRHRRSLHSVRQRRRRLSRLRAAQLRKTTTEEEEGERGADLPSSLSRLPRQQMDLPASTRRVADAEEGENRRHDRLSPPQRPSRRPQRRFAERPPDALRRRQSTTAQKERKTEGDDASLPQRRFE